MRKKKMSKEEQEKRGSKTTRRDFIKGVGAGAVVAAAAVAGVEELRIGQMQAAVPKAPVVAPSQTSEITLDVNGKSRRLQVPNNWTLLEVLREELELFSVKEGCGTGECGACTVIVDGKAVNSCQLLAVEAQGKKITTLEGISDYAKNLDPLQQAWITNEAAACGYCAPGMILSAKALLDANPKPSSDDILDALSGNLCVCGNYKKIYQSVAQVAGV
jgi:aerobic-type carbon monoxide dehydrogenase small subunit (CoxS/CutS family)